MYEQFSEVELGGWKPSCPAVLVVCDPVPLAQFHSRNAPVCSVLPLYWGGRVDGAEAKGIT